MPVAAIYDIHGNLPALEAVLAEIRAEGIDAIVVGGDVVPGPMPRQTLDLLQTLEIPVDFIHGNGEQDLLTLHRGEEMTRVPEPVHELMAWVASRLNSGHFDWMATWPMTVRREISGLGRVLFCHATPRDDNEIFTVRTPAESLVPAFEEADADVVVCGHTHMQFDRTIGEVRVVNAGSAGMPFGEPGAYWLRLDHGVEMRRTSYDLDAAAVRIEATGCPQVPGLNPNRPLAEDVMLESFERSKKPTQESGRIP